MSTNRLMFNDGNIGSVTVTGSQLTSNVVTLTCGSQGFLVGQEVTVSGVQGALGAQAATYNGTFQIASVSGSQFTYAVTHADIGPQAESTGSATLLGLVSPIPTGTTEVPLLAPNGATFLWVYGESQALTVRQTSGTDLASFVVPSATWKALKCRAGDNFYINRGSSTKLDFYFERADN